MNVQSFAPWVLGWALLAGIVARRGYLSLVTAIAAASVVLLLSISSTPVVGALTRGWVRADPIHSPIDAVVVLSSNVKSDSLLDASGTERLLSAIEVQRATHAPRLITTRVRSIYDGKTLSTDPGQRRLLALAGADTGWTIADSVGSTRDEAMRAARLLLPSAKRIAVVTSPLHTNRACATFEGVGFVVTCVPAREIARVTTHPGSPDDRLAAFRSYLYERLGMIKYRWKGWIHG